jgi:hypothetical protein
MAVFDYSPAVAAGPEAYRIHAREESHPNSVAEQTEIKRVDDAVFGRVRVYENSLVDSAQALVERGTALTRETTQVKQSSPLNALHALWNWKRSWPTRSMRTCARRITPLTERSSQRSSWVLALKPANRRRRAQQTR